MMTAVNLFVPIVMKEQRDVLSSNRGTPERSERLMEELKPCPFCGSKTVKKIGPKNGRYIVYCCGCWCQTNEECTEAEAVRLWNTRSGEK
jgi:hypothetical protein